MSVRCAFESVEKQCSSTQTGNSHTDTLTERGNGGFEDKLEVLRWMYRNHDNLASSVVTFM